MTSPSLRREYDRLYPLSDLQEHQARVADGLARRTQSPQFAQMPWQRTRTWAAEVGVLLLIVGVVLAFYVAW